MELLCRKAQWKLQLMYCLAALICRECFAGALDVMCQDVVYADYA